jgi:hypothetical protein
MSAGDNIFVAPIYIHGFFYKIHKMSTSNEYVIYGGVLLGLSFDMLFTLPRLYLDIKKKNSKIAVLTYICTFSAFAAILFNTITLCQFSYEVRDTYFDAAIYVVISTFNTISILLLYILIFIRENAFYKKIISFLLRLACFLGSIAAIVYLCFIFMYYNPIIFGGASYQLTWYSAFGFSAIAVQTFAGIVFIMSSLMFIFNISQYLGVGFKRLLRDLLFDFNGSFYVFLISIKLYLIFAASLFISGNSPQLASVYSIINAYSSNLALLCFATSSFLAPVVLLEKYGILSKNAKDLVPTTNTVAVTDEIGTEKP